MDANTFETLSSGKSAKEAFNAACDQARYEDGHGGYTGTIAEKHEFTMIDTVASVVEASKLADKFINEGDPRVDDKWGPAGCIKITGKAGETPKFLFFGWASS